MLYARIMPRLQIILLFMLIPLVLSSLVVTKSGGTKRAFIIWMPSYSEYEFVNPDLYDLIEELLTEEGYVTYTFHDPDELYSYLSTGVRQDDVLINLHGSVFPLPSNLQGKNGAFKIIELIGSRIKERGLHFINIAGLPFSAFSNKKKGYWIRLDFQGIETFASDLGYDVNVISYHSSPITLTTAHLTKEGDDIATKYSIMMPSMVSATYSLSTNIEPFFSVYSTDARGYFGIFETVALFKLGNGFYGHVGIDWESYKVKVNAAILLALKVLEHRGENSLYIIAANDADWYGIDMISAKSYTEELLNSLNVNYSVITRSDDLVNILNKEYDAILLNLHGEVFPIPREYISGNDRLGISISYLERLAEFVKNGGVIINVAGRPFFALSNRLKNFWFMVGERGLISFFSFASDYKACGFVYDHSSHGFIGAELTDFGRSLVRKVYAKYLWSGVLSPYVINCTIPAIFSFYRTKDGLFAHATFIIGEGTFTYIGLSTDTPSETILTIVRVTLELLEKRNIVVKVVEGESGKVLENTYIEVYTVNDIRLASGLTGKDGILTLLMRGGEYIVRVLHPSYSSKSVVTYVINSTEHIVISLYPTMLHINVQDAFTHKPIVNASVTIYDVLNHIISCGTTDNNGYAAFKLKEGEYIISVRAEGYESRNATVQVHGNTTFIMLLRNTVTKLTVVVVDSITGTPLSGVLLKVRSSNGSSSYSVTTGINGEAVITLPSKGPLTIEAYYHNVKVGVAIVDSPLMPAEMKIKLPISLEAYYKTKYEGLKAKYSNLSKMYSELNTRYTELLSAYEGLMEKYMSVNRSYIELQSNYTMLLNNYTRVVSQLVVLERICNELIANNTELATENNILMEKLHLLNATYLELLSDYNELRDSYEELLNRYTGLIEEYEDVLSKYSRLRKYWPLATAIAGVVGLIGGIMLGYTYIRRRGEYLVVPS